MPPLSKEIILIKNSLYFENKYIDKYDKHNIGVDDNNYNIVSFNKLKYISLALTKYLADSV